MNELELNRILRRVAVVAGHIKYHVEGIKGEKLDPLDFQLLETLVKSLNDDIELLKLEK